MVLRQPAGKARKIAGAHIFIASFDTQEYIASSGLEAVMPNFIAPRVCIDFDGTGNLVTWGRTPKGPKGPKGSRKPAKRSGKLKSVSGWHPATLGIYIH